MCERKRDCASERVGGDGAQHWAGGSMTGRETNWQPLGSEWQHGILERAHNIVGIPTQLGSEGYYPEGLEPSYKRGRPAGISM